MAYWHRQRGYSCLFVYAFAAFFAAECASEGLSHLERAVFATAALLFLALASGIHHLTVSDDGEWLAIQLGPLPLFRERVRYDRIRDVAVTKSNVFDGGPLGYNIFRDAWSYRIRGWWGEECVLLTLTSGKVLIGTDEPERLADFIRDRMRQVPDEARPALARK